jgi:hypothetical protein
MIRVPEFKEPGLTRFLADFDRQLENERATKLSKVTANHSLLLQADNGKVYEVRVSNAGALVLTLLSSAPP